MSDESASQGVRRDQAAKGSMKSVAIRFRNAAARKAYLAALRRRWKEVGYSADYIDDWIRAVFDPKLPVAYVFGRDDADRAADVALDIPGVSYTFEESA